VHKYNASWSTSDITYSKADGLSETELLVWLRNISPSLADTFDMIKLTEVGDLEIEYTPYMLKIARVISEDDIDNAIIEIVDQAVEDALTGV
jgi:hypothetical protein